MSPEKISQEFSLEIKSKKRKERIDQGIPPGARIEVDHILAKYAGGTSDESNAAGRTIPEHGFKHFIHAHDPGPSENSRAEWAATRYIIGRMSLDEFTDFLGLVEPMIPELRQELQELRQRYQEKRS